MRDDPRNILAGHDYQFARLRGHWETAKKGIRASEGHSRDFKCESYRLLQETEDGYSISFELFGALCYVAFVHDLEQGYLEYGAIDPTYPNSTRRIPVESFPFDIRGTLAEQWAIVDEHSVTEFHLHQIASLAQRLIRAFFDAYYRKEAPNGWTPDREKPDRGPG